MPNCSTCRRSLPWFVRQDMLQRASLKYYKAGDSISLADGVVRCAISGRFSILATINSPVATNQALPPPSLSAHPCIQEEDSTVSRLEDPVAISAGTSQTPTRLLTPSSDDSAVDACIDACMPSMSGSSGPSDTPFDTPSGTPIQPPATSSGVTPASGRVMPTSGVVTPASAGFTPASGGGTPAVGGITLASGGVTPASGGVTPAPDVHRMHGDGSFHEEHFPLRPETGATAEAVASFSSIYGDEQQCMSDMHDVTPCDTASQSCPPRKTVTYKDLPSDLTTLLTANQQDLEGVGNGSGNSEKLPPVATEASAEASMDLMKDTPPATAHTKPTSTTVPEHQSRCMSKLEDPSGAENY